MGTINGILPPRDNSRESRYQVFLDVDGATGYLKMSRCSKNEGDTLWVKIIGFDDSNCRVRLGPPVERWKVIQKNKFPAITVQQEDGKKTSITLHSGWDSLIAGCYYYFRLTSDGIKYDVDGNRIIRDFLKQYPEGSQFTGKIVSEDYMSFFVDVGGYGCMIQKGVPGSYGLRVGEEHSFSTFRIDEKRHLIHLRIER